MCTLHAVAAVNGHAEGCRLEIVSGFQSAVCIRSVAVENIHSVVDPVFHSKIDQAACETVVVGSGVILGADAYLSLAAVEVRTDKAYIDSIIKNNAEKANYYALKTLRKVQKKVGFPERIR